MLNSPKIIWEKWIDPFGKDIDEAKWTDYNNNITDFKNIINTDTLDTNDPQYRPEIINNPIKVIASPLGIIPYNEHTASSKIFNFWVGHTNFNLSSEIVNAFEKCEGIEILDIFTRYRLRIAIGKCFIDNEVMRNIASIAENLLNINES